MKHVTPNESGFDNEKLVTNKTKAHTDHKRHTIPHDLGTGLVENKTKAHEDQKRHTIPHDLGVDLVEDKIKAHAGD